MAKKVKIGIVGLGFMGTTHYGIYKSNSKAEVAAIADVDAAKRKGDIRKVIGNIGGGDNSKPLDLNGIKTYADGMDLINDPDVDVVDICVPTFLHCQYAVAALKAGKHVFCEKPLARNVKEAEAIIAEARKSDKFFSLGMCIRYWPEYSYARELYQSGKLGKLRSATFTRLSPSIAGNAWKNWFMDGKLSGGALLDLHLHDADAVRFFFGRPQAVTAFGTNSRSSDGAMDHVITNYEFGDGALVAAEGGWAAAKGVPFEMSFQIICEKATIVFNAAGFKIYYENGRVEAPKPANPALPTGWHEELDYFLGCVQKKQRPDKFITLEEMLDSMKIITAEQQSADKRKTVKIKY
ncbi:MAG: Gfo/Idh/MocA family oxidoreductase [Lentisphaerota bacterium]